MTESLHFVKYRKLENQLVIFADDQVMLASRILGLHMNQPNTWIAS